MVKMFVKACGMCLWSALEMCCDIIMFRLPRSLRIFSPRCDEDKELIERGVENVPFFCLLGRRWWHGWEGDKFVEEKWLCCWFPYPFTDFWRIGFTGKDQLRDPYLGFFLLSLNSINTNFFRFPSDLNLLH